MTELAPGTTLGPYRILSKLGEGGMGAVYRAHDPRLARDVAIKVSGERFSERFEREARAIAALNHTNVCHLYDVGPDYLVMELVEGEPPRGPLPLDQAVPMLRQIFVMRADGSDARQLTDTTYNSGTPAWLPDNAASGAAGGGRQVR